LILKFLYHDIVHTRMEVSSDEYRQQEKEECVICLDDVETEWRDLECRHRYHKQCIEEWITVRAKCPMCMKSIENNIEERNINNSLIEEVHYIAIRRFMLFILLVICVIVVMVLCST
jgi:hypothetical protein